MSSPTGLERAESLRPDALALHAEIVALVADDLQRVEATFRAHLASPIQIVEEIGGFVAEGGGKRVRPTLHLLCARLCGYSGQHAPLIGTVLEFIHCATLIHDDILDGAALRRGRPSVNDRWGNNLSVLFGDYMLAKAMQLALEARDLSIMEKLAEVTLRMTEGEMLQTRYQGRMDLREADYLELIDKKTAALFGCCCELAGILAAREPEELHALRRYGVQVGLAFQLVDDLLDLAGDPARIGKPAASDLREHKLTHAVIDLLSTAAPGASDLVARAMQPDADPGVFDELGRLLREQGCLERSHALARRFAAGAVAELEGFPDGPARRALRALPDLLLRRDH